MVTCEILSINLRISGGRLVGEVWRPKQDVPSQLLSLRYILTNKTKRDWPTMRWMKIYKRHYFILSLQSSAIINYGINYPSNYHDYGVYQFHVLFNDQNTSPNNHRKLSARFRCRTSILIGPNYTENSRHETEHSL